MSLHPSLKVDTAGSQQRTVLTRIERIKDLMKKGLWKDGQSVTNLPKTKIVRVKAKSKKQQEEAKDQAAEGKEKDGAKEASAK